MTLIQTTIITLLKNGYNEKEMQVYLKAHNLPSGIKTIKNHIEKIKEEHAADSLFELALILKKKKLI